MIYRIPTREDYAPIVTDIETAFADELRRVMARPSLKRVVEDAKTLATLYSRGKARP